MTDLPDTSLRPDADSFRAVLGRFATGVTVMTTRENGHPHGMTANAVTSVSLDPLLVLVCVERSAMMAEHVESSRVFALSFLGAEQAALSEQFADPERPTGGDQFDGVETTDLQSGTSGKQVIADYRAELPTGPLTVSRADPVVNVLVRNAGVATWTLSFAAPLQWRSSLRVPSPSFPRALRTWKRTASRLMPRRFAIAASERPWRTAFTTRHSAGVSRSSYGGRPRFLFMSHARRWGRDFPSPCCETRSQRRQSEPHVPAGTS